MVETNLSILLKNISDQYGNFYTKNSNHFLHIPISSRLHVSVENKGSLEFLLPINEKLIKHITLLSDDLNHDRLSGFVEIQGSNILIPRTLAEEYDVPIKTEYTQQKESALYSY